MARTSEADVRLIISTGLTSAQVVEFINDASLYVTAKLGDSGLSDAVLEAIEKYIAAGYITARDPVVMSAKRLETTETYKYADYFAIAAALDTTGVIGDDLVPNRTRGLIRIGAGYDSRHTSAGIGG